VLFYFFLGMVAIWLQKKIPKKDHWFVPANEAAE
jgi:hypothetical protein